MESTRVTVYISLLAICLAIFIGETSATTCYVCDSGSAPACQANFFVSVGITQETSCACCRKSVSDSGTTRECVGYLTAAVKCIPVSGTYICNDDYCNAANPIGQRGITLAIATSLMVGIISIFRLF